MCLSFLELGHVVNDSQRASAHLALGDHSSAPNIANPACAMLHANTTLTHQRVRTSLSVPAASTGMSFWAPTVTSRYAASTRARRSCLAPVTRFHSRRGPKVCQTVF